MANIKVNDLKTAGVELFADSESFMNELNENDVNYINGGLMPTNVTQVCTMVQSCM